MYQCERVCERGGPMCQRESVRGSATFVGVGQMRERRREVERREGGRWNEV